jgi:glycosyltransferase involved in cell wall biosynthesis
MVSGLPMTHHIHSPAIRDTSNAWANRVNALVERGSLLRAAALIPVSDSLARYLAGQGYPARRICPVPNGVATSELHTNCELHDDLRLAMVALFRPRKGVEVLLRAMALLIRQGQLVRLKAIGGFENADYEQQIHALAERLGVSDYVEWRGFQPDVLQELTSVDALVLPSLFGEGMPMVVLEAMAVGLPIVASAVEGVPEVVREGQEGLLVAPNDVNALADALLRLLHDRLAARSMGHAARRRQRSSYSDRAMASRVSGIYDRLLGRSPVALPAAAS